VGFWVERPRGSDGNSGDESVGSAGGRETDLVN
jgi:hypothetical protein